MRVEIGIKFVKKTKKTITILHSISMPFPKLIFEKIYLESPFYRYIKKGLKIELPCRYDGENRELR